jgi:acyl-CoA thioester hydrolase
LPESVPRLLAASEGAHRHSKRADLPRWQNHPMPLSPTFSKSIPRPDPEWRSAYRVFRSITTRWSDNDMYGHVNNVVYYSWFDTAVNGWLIEQGALDVPSGESIGLVVETGCNYFAPLAFPEPVTAGIRVAHIGNSSVRYEIALFPADASQSCAARGHFVHVYVDRETRRPMPLAPNLIAILETLQ